ncbi:Neuron navigator 2 [Anabarilius grahami]|uniref:Neuron navigator 2 n=1 Tax=Anabarilius grahami TaxID=495550 RepID=A0A3N0YCT7_ANAGA|nr:Neuron navigator 2 [Anabarilius grahami]
MPAILVVTNMKSGLPKPIHSALPIPQVPTRAVAPRPCFTSPPQSSAHLHLGSDWAPGKNYHPADSEEDTQMYFLHLSLDMSIKTSVVLSVCLFKSHPFVFALWYSIIETPPCR